MDNEYLYFETRKDVAVYINGELRKDYIEKRDYNIPGGSFKRFLMYVPLKEADSGTETVIIRKSPQDIDRGIPEVFIIAAWLITDSSLFPFIFGVYHVNGFLSFTLCLMIPLALIIYIASLHKGRYKKSMSFIILVSILNAVGWPLLHFTGIVPFYNVIDLANGVLVFLAVDGIVILVIDAVKGNTESYRYTYIGFLGFL